MGRNLIRDNRRKNVSLYSTPSSWKKPIRDRYAQQILDGSCSSMLLMSSRYRKYWIREMSGTISHGLKNSIFDMSIDTSSGNSSSWQSSAIIVSSVSIEH